MKEDKEPRFIWMEIDVNNKGLPVAVADTAKELARLRGVKEQSIHRAVMLAKRGGYQCKYIRVENEEAKPPAKLKQNKIELTDAQLEWAYQKWVEGYSFENISKALLVSSTLVKVALKDKNRNVKRTRKKDTLVYEEQE